MRLDRDEDERREEKDGVQGEVGGEREGEGEGQEGTYGSEQVSFVPRRMRMITGPVDTPSIALETARAMKRFEKTIVLRARAVPTEKGCSRYL